MIHSFMYELADNIPCPARKINHRSPKNGVKPAPVSTGGPNQSRLRTETPLSGEADKISRLAKKLSHRTSYVTRILSLTILAPDIVESILDGTEPDGISIAKITEHPIPEDWNEQRRLFGFQER